MILLKNTFSTLALTVIVLVCFSGCAPAKKPAAGLQVVSVSRIGEEKLQVAVMPIANLSRKRAPLHLFKRLLRNALRKEGFNVLDDTVLEGFLSKYRIRYVGGLDRVTIRALREDTGVQAVFLTSLEHYDEQYPPKISITSRLVSTEDNPKILWVDSVGIAGDDSPALLGLGLVKDPKVLLERAVQHISFSLSEHLADVKKESTAPLPSKRIRTVRSPLIEYPKGVFPDDIPYEASEVEERSFRPKTFFRPSTVIDKERKYSVAVLPFFNKSEKKYAGEIMANHFMSEMEDLANIHIIEPGVVRESLLKFRVVMRDGISLDNAAVLFSRLNADLIITGTVLDYEDYRGPYGKPLVDFSVIVIERKSLKAIWTSKSTNEGDDAVFFFDIGKINTANLMASEMVKGVIEEMLK